MKYNRHLANRFVSDYKLPIPITSREDFFYYYLELLEKDYSALTKWNKLVDVINERFNGNSEDFLKYYLEIRENIINSMHKNPYYVEFNNMDMSKFAIKEKLNISSNNIYNCNNVNKIFLSIDLKKANFQALKYVNPEIVFNSKSYDDFINKFTDLPYIKESKYFRSVFFGQLNPKRHITVEKYIINQIRILLDEIFELNSNDENYPLISMSNDELVYANPVTNIPSLFNDKNSYEIIIDELKSKIKNKLGFDVHIELFMLDGYELYSLDTLKIHKTFFNKFNLIDDSNKLMCVPLPFFPVVYKLFNKQEVVDKDLYFDYEKLIAKMEEKLGLHIITKGDFETHYIPSLKKRLCCNNKYDTVDYTLFTYTDEDIENNLDYFKQCYLSNTSVNIALEMFYDYLTGNYNE